ncbi:hypothetical protein LPJ59_005974 [Coemansia sp. RSA 2399]|nr:hypothetical protein LPJ59_005974 [Coemansia sp. RSA 2399]
MARCAGLIRSPDASELFGELLKRQPNASEALAYVGKVHPADGYHDVVSLATARRLAQSLDYRGAVDELSRLARRHPGSAPVRAYQATCRYMMNDVSAALALYERARTLDPGLMDQMGTYATLLASSTGDAHAVYRLGNELLKVDQGRAEGWVAMAQYFLLSGETQEALAIAWRAQTLSPSYACAYYTEGVIQLASGSVDDALDVFTKAHQLERNALTFRAVIESLVQCGRYKEAFVYAREMAELLP